MTAFALDSRLARDTLAVMPLGLSEVRLMNDARWPWLVLVPRRPGIVEFHDLTPLDQTLLTFETDLAGKALKTATAADKLNVGALGNIVAMFHLHIVARSVGDANWPGPVWGHGTAEPYAGAAAERLTTTIRDALMAA